MSISEHLGRQVEKTRRGVAEQSKKTSHKHGHASHVRIEKADNGYSVESREEHKNMETYREPEKAVFGHKDHKKMMKHVSECLGCGEAEEDRDAGGAPKKEREQEKN